MERGTKEDLVEQLNQILINGDGSTKSIGYMLDYILCKAKEVPRLEYEQEILPIITSSHQCYQASSPSTLFHYSKQKNRFLQEFLSNHDLKELAWQLRNGKNSLPVRSHSKRNFTGSSLVDWLVGNYGDITDRSEARCIADYLQQHEKLFYHPRHLFRDDNTLFVYTLPKRVVIVGGGFGGSHIAKSLEKDGSYQVIIIAPNLFECIPSLPFLIGNPEHATKIRADHINFLPTTKVIRQKAIEITPRYVVLEDTSIIPFDTLVIATGSRYPMPFEGDNVFDATNGDDMIDATITLGKVNSACVVGAGSVGIEVASEIAAKFPHVKLSIVSSSELFLERTVPDAHKYVHEYFSSFDNVTLVMGERLQSFEDNIVTTNAGSTVSAEVLFPCLGFIPRTDLLKDGMEECVDEKGFLKMKNTLQLEEYENIFAAGDIVPFDTEKLAQNAEAHADIIVKNIKLLDKREFSKMKTYTPHNRVMLVSLGPKRCLMINGNHVLMEGAATRLLKTLVEKKVMHAFK